MNERPKGVTWASQNMLVLGIIVILGIFLHLYNFWWNMQLPEVLHLYLGINVDVTYAQDGVYYIIKTFQDPVYASLYVVWLAALWFHLTHGFWSAMQTLGISNKVWFCRWKVAGNIFATIVVLGFLAVLIAGAAGVISPATTTQVVCPFAA